MPRLTGSVSRLRPGVASPRFRWEMPAETAWDTALTDTVTAGARHPLADAAVSLPLRRRAEEIEAAFAAIEPALRSLVPLQFEDGFPARASGILRDRLQIDIPPRHMQASWVAPLDVPRLYARCVLASFCRLAERTWDREVTGFSEGESAGTLIQRWGFHAIDITPCADGRLSGVLDHILRVPPSIVAYRKSYAGAMFKVGGTLRHWESVELQRWRQALPNAASAPTRFLKVGVYHFSSVDPSHEGCAAHGSDDARAAGLLLERLECFQGAIRNIHGENVSPAILLVGVDTDTDAIRVHVPDASGRMDLQRFVDTRMLYDSTASVTREDAKQVVRAAVADCARVAADHADSEGMRWFCGYLLKNNIAQVDAVRHWHGGRYDDAGHTERLMVVGDAMDDVQLRNLAFQAQMRTVEEGAADLDVGIGILRKLHERRGLAVPVLVHVRYDTRIPGAQLGAQAHARRLVAAILARHDALARRGLLHVQAVLRAGDGSAIVPVDVSEDEAANNDAMKGAHA